jgi:ribosomal protein S18 acetylase RimI-like enzyme
MDLYLRRAGDQDGALVVRLFRIVVEHLEIYNQKARRAELARYSEDFVRDLIGEDADAIWIAYDGGEPVGFSITKHDGDLWWICWFGVVPSARGYGVGRKLVENVINVARARGVSKVWCDTRTENERSIGILYQIGFERICDIREHWFGQDYVLWQIRP